MRFFPSASKAALARGWSVAERLRQKWKFWFPPPTLGQRGEALAARWLARHGYKIVARGSRGALGEIDLVAVDGRTVVFVEVKTRRSQDAGHPADAVDHDKQRRLTRLAIGYLRRHGLLEYPVRFDVVAITWPEGRGKPTVEHFKNAFNAVGCEGMFS
ncbi:MAG TPA: YraN family protein [Pirellulales bacterium]|jgi:putative endonuclease|nr:YraN family protein [Pirellulales bacterium]